MKKKFMLFISALVAVTTLTGCGSGSKNYTASDGSFSIELPNDKWEVYTEDASSGMYIFSLPKADGGENDTDNDALILYYNLSAESGNLSYDTIPTTQEELEASFGESLDYEILNFEGDLSDDGTKSNYYSIGYTDEDSSKGYIVTKTEANETTGYIIAGQVSVDDQNILDEVTKAIDSLVVNQ